MRTVLFTGYARVHAACFMPAYERLRGEAGLEILFSGGFREKGAGGDGETRYRIEGFYDPFGLDAGSVLPFEEASGLDVDVVVCAHTSDLLFPRSARRSVQIFHGVSFKNLSVREKVLRYDYACLPGPYHARRYLERGLLGRGTRCLVTGFAKMDALASGRHSRREALLGRSLDPSRPTVLLAPTGERGNAMEAMGIDAVRAIAAGGDLNLLVRPHDHPKDRSVDWREALKPFESERVRISRCPDISGDLAAADVLVTDASSVAVEYTLLDRPIVFLDVPGLFERIRGRSDAFDLETYGRRIGTVAADAKSLPGAIRGALSDPGRESAWRRRMAGDVFYRPGDAASRVADVIRHAAGLIEEIPAGIPAAEELLAIPAGAEA